MRNISDAADQSATGMMRLRFGIFSALLACTFGCAPELSYDGRLVQVVNDIESAQCRHLSNSRITLSKMQILVHRTPEKQARLLLVEARNLAGEIGADHVIPLGEQGKNSQMFKFYICG